ncbi:MAG TPA: ferrochelatase [Pedomonas sp.]|uniref:ferrochelatase n=1 Tax=Pedomonas sp. TaxID=2976421 RepID=UPI002F41009A
MAQPAPVPAQTANPASGPAPAGHPQVAHGRIGVLLVNLGTPDGTDYRSIRRYLSEFLSDPRVVEIPRLVWQPILQGIILTLRPSKTAEGYKRVWDKERNQSPLRVITEAQAISLQHLLGDRVMVGWAMRYGNPAIRVELDRLKAAGCDRILIAPLYPQYSGATTATAVDKANDALREMRWQPTVRYLPPYHDDPAFIQALAQSVRAHIDGLGYTPDHLVASFHGMPRRTLDLGDPYHCQCQKTARLMREALGWPAERFTVTFQSRFGKAEWLKPYTSDVMAALPSKGVRSVAVLAPAFSADCIETLDELAVENKELFLHAGGEAFSYIPCLNASEGGMAVLETLVRRELAGWL